MVNKNILSYPVIVWYCMRGSIAITIVLTWIFLVGDIVWSSFSSAAKERAMKLHGYSPSSLFMKKSFLFLPPLKLPLTYHGWPLSTHKWPGSLMGDPWPINDDPNTLNDPQTLKPGTIIDNPETPYESPLDLSSSPRPFFPFILILFFFLNQKIVRRTKKMKKKHHFYFFYIQVGRWGFPTPLVPSPWPHVYPNGSVTV